MDEMSPPLALSSSDRPSGRRARQACPQCGHTLYRVHRRPLDRLASLFVPLRRYRCDECGWSGLHVSTHVERRPREMLLRNTTRLALIAAALAFSVLAAVLISMIGFPVR